MKSTSNHDKIMKRYSWESEELFQLRKIKYKLIVVCEKPSMSNFASLCGLVEAEETRLIKRDSYENNNKIEVPIMYYTDDETNERVYDIEEMANEFENRISRITKVSVMCSIVEDDEIKTSECCGKEMHEDYDLCPKCLEHT